MQFRQSKKSNKIKQKNSDFKKEQAEAFKRFMKVHFGDEASSCNVKYSFEENKK